MMMMIFIITREYQVFLLQDGIIFFLNGSKDFSTRKDEESVVTPDKNPKTLIITTYLSISC